MVCRHLPESLVASFIKRLSRLSLLAPACALPMIFDFITNLIIQHPGLKVLLNPKNRDGSPKIKDISVPALWEMDFESFSSVNQLAPSELLNPDPFDEEETDPMKTKALESWLCEIKTLQNHTVSSVALQAKFIGKTIPKVERDMDKTLSLTYEEVSNISMWNAIIWSSSDTASLFLFLTVGGSRETNEHWAGTDSIAY